MRDVARRAARRRKRSLHHARSPTGVCVCVCTTPIPAQRTATSVFGRRGKKNIAFARTVGFSCVCMLYVCDHAAVCLCTHVTIFLYVRVSARPCVFLCMCPLLCDAWWKFLSAHVSACVSVCMMRASASRMMCSRVGWRSEFACSRISLPATEQVGETAASSASVGAKRRRRVPDVVQCETRSALIRNHYGR